MVKRANLLKTPANRKQTSETYRSHFEPRNVYAKTQNERNLMTLSIKFTWERGAAMLYWLSDLAVSSRHL